MLSWAGMCPGQHESAGRSRHGTARRGDTWLQRTLAVAAMAAARAKGTHLAAQYGRLAGRRGKRRARKAVGHSILVGCRHILRDGVEWVDLGTDHFDRRHDPGHLVRRKLNDLRSLGWAVETGPDGTTTLRATGRSLRVTRSRARRGCAPILWRAHTLTTHAHFTSERHLVFT